jgi:acylaminoacyl-peptidase
MRNVVVAVGLAALAAVRAGSSAELPGLKAEDAFELELAADPQISPDGRWVVYVRQFADVRTDRRYSNLWLVGFDGSGHRPLTTGLFSDRAPRWSPDGGRVAFVSDREGGAQIHLLWLDGGAAARLTNLQSAPAGLAWSPDGRWIAFTAVVRGEGPKIATLPKPPEGATWAEPARVVDRLVYRFNAAGYLPEGYSHLFVVPATGGTARQISSGDFHHGPAGRGGGQPQWTPDGRHLLIAANRRPDWDLESLDTEIYEFALADGSVRALTDRRGPDEFPAVSPDGRRIAYVGFDDRYQGYQVQRLYVLDRQGGAPRLLSADLDRDVENPRFTPDGQGILFVYDDQGRSRLGLFSLDGTRRDVASDLGSGTGASTSGAAYSLAANGHLAFTHKRWDVPGDVAATTLAGGTARALTALNEDLFAQRRLAEPEEIWLESSLDRRRIHAWLLRPPGAAPEAKAPLILEIHGGPFAAYGPLFDLEKQVWAGLGYAVLYSNPRGSTSYGEEFGNLIHHAYPGDDFYDLDSAVDAALARGGLDPENLFVTGGSGGGVLTCWMIGRSDRFRAAAPAYPVINWTSWVLTADIAAFGAKYWFPGLPWEQPEHYAQRSLLSVVGNVKTPTMVITGEDDWRTPISESEQYYTALKLRGVEAVLVRVPGEPHGIRSRPSHHVSKMLHIAGWFDRHRQDAP